MWAIQRCSSCRPRSPLPGVGDALQKEGGPEHLNIHPEFIHVLEADLDVLGLLGPLVAQHLAAELLF